VPELPHGTVTLLFSDVEGSTRHLLRLNERYPGVLTRHREILAEAIEAYRGVLVDTQGDGTFAAFPTAHGAILAAIRAQHALNAEPWPEEQPFKVRIGIHTGEPMVSRDGYAGLDVHRAARLCAAAHGGQVLVSQTTRDLAIDALPGDVTFIDLGTHLLKDLPQPERLVQLVSPGLATEFAAPRALGAPSSLPANRQPLIGRDRELETCRELILRDGVNLVSLTGPGGTGKTALAIHLAASLLPIFPDGVHFVPLAAITDPDLVPGAVARVLGIQDQTTRPIAEVITDAIGNRSILMVLDNFEHLAPAMWLVADMVESCPALKVLVTSRELLRLSREHDVPIPPLDLPPAQASTLDVLTQNDAVRLFVARAQSVRPGFRITPETGPIIGEICRRLDGLPLALELAAARVRMLSPQALLSRLDRRLPLLTDGPRDRPARQRTLRDTIGWSYGLLTEDERFLFRALGAFVGGCSLEAAEAVCWSDDAGMGVLDALGSLVDKSLVRQEVTDDEPRFSLLETIREFALEQLEAGGDAPEIRRRHASFYLEFAERVDPLLIGHDQVMWLDRLELDHGNLSAALTWARDGRLTGDQTACGIPAADAGIRLAGALHWFWWLGGHIGEGRQWLAEVMSWEIEEHRRPEFARSRFAAGVLTMIQGDYQPARQLLNEAANMAEATGDTQLLGRCLGYRRIVEVYLHDMGLLEMAQVRQTTERALDVLTATTDAWGLALVQSLYGVSLRRAGEHQRAAQVLRNAIALAQTTGDHYLIGTCLPKLGTTLVELGDLDAAEPLYGEALEHLAEIRDGWWASRCIQFLAGVAAQRGDYRRAALLLGTADATIEAVGAHRVPVEAREYEQVIKATHEHLDDVSFAETYERGRSMPMESLLQFLKAAPTISVAH